MNGACALQHHEWNHNTTCKRTIDFSGIRFFSTITLSFMIRPCKCLGMHLKLILFIVALVHEQPVCASPELSLHW